MEIGKGTSNMLSGLTTLGVGVLAWEYQSTAKYGAGSVGADAMRGFTLTSKWRFGAALSGLIGYKGAAQLGFIGLTPGYSDFHPTPMGFLNKVFAGGVLLKIVNAALRKYLKVYDNLDSIPEIVDGGANGLIIGGAVGGIFDPAPLASSPAGHDYQGQGSPSNGGGRNASQLNASLGGY